MAETVDSSASKAEALAATFRAAVAEKFDEICSGLAVEGPVLRVAATRLTCRLDLYRLYKARPLTKVLKLERSRRLVSERRNWESGMD